MNGLRRGVFLGISCLALAACGTSNNYIPSHTTAPPATATPVAVAQSVATSAPFNGGAAVTNAAVTAPVPAPAGYSQSVTIPLVSAAANTMISTVASASPPPSIAALSSGRSTLGVRNAKDTASYSVLLYDSIMPSANITASGNISFTESFPAGGLVAGTSYYLAFYDTTQASPTWQTIAGPVTPSGQNLTFSGTTSSVTLQANKLYGFATFSGVTPSATPPPAPVTLLYYGNDSGITIATEAGVQQASLPIPSQSFDLDDSGNVYAFDHNHGGSESAKTGSPQLALFPAGSSTATATYTLSLPDYVFVSASGAGEVAAIHNVNSAGNITADIWDPGATGTPSRTVSLPDPSGAVSFAMTHDGTLYLFGTSAAGVPQFDVYPPGASTPSRVIPETIVASSQYANFAPNYSAVGPDGTLYVTEYSFNQPDPNAGLYIYPPSGPEKFIATPANANGPGPQGVDVDGSGNIYVVNNNYGYTSNTACQTDSLHEVTVYSAAGALERTITSSFTGFPITTAADGTSFVSSFGTTACPGVQGIFAIAPGASTATQISTTGSTEIILYDGTHKTEPFSTSTRSVGGVARGTRGIHRAIP
jgi:sugar lactone lactonase YvrE